MPESPDQAAVQRRANRIGLRTLRQRPKVVDRTESGRPIYEIRSVRLLLPDHASHFSRLERCSRCKRGLAGSPVLTPADLDQPTQAMVCKDCVRTAAISPSRHPENRPMEPEPAAPQASEEQVPEEQVPEEQVPEEQVPEPVAAEPGDGRLAAVEAQLQAVMARLADLTTGQQSEATQRRRADDATQSRIHAAMVRGLDDLQARVTAALEVGATRVVALEDHVRRSGAQVAELLRGQRGELAALSGSMAETRSELHRLIDLIGQRPDDSAVERRIEDALAGLARSIEAHRAEVHAAVSEGITQAGAQVSALEQQLHEGVAALTQMVLELAGARDRVAARLDDLGQKVREAEARIDSVAASADAGVTRMQALEQEVRESVDRLTRRVETKLEERWTLTSAKGPVPGGLLVDIERELQAAQNRLANRVISTRDPG